MNVDQQNGETWVTLTRQEALRLYQSLDVFFEDDDGTEDGWHHHVDDGNALTIATEN